MKTYKLFIISIAIGLASSCAIPKLTNNDRGKYGYEKLDLPEDVLEVSISALPLPEAPKKPKEKPKTFFDLRDSIPNTFLKVIGNKAQNTKEITDAIKEQLSVIENTTNTTQTIVPNTFDTNEIKVRLLFTNIKKYYNEEKLMHPNTRLEFLTTTLKLKSNNFSIVSIDKIENEFEQIDLGTLQRSQDVTFNSKLSIEGDMGGALESNESNSTTENKEIKSNDTKNIYDENGKLLGTVSLTDNSNMTNTKNKNTKTNISNNASGKGELQYINNESIKEALQVKFKKLKTGFSFSPNSITISQRGTLLSDISDNIVVTTTLKANNTQLDEKIVTKFSNLFDANGKPNPIQNIGRNYINVQYIPCNTSNDVNFLFDYSGAIRSVKNLKRGRNVLEFDDKVVYYKFSKENVPSKITINKTEICNNIYKVIATFEEDEEFTLNIVDANTNEVLIYDNHNPNLFLEWLIKLIQENDISKFKSSTVFVFVNKNGSKMKYLSKADFSQNDLDKLLKLTGLGFQLRKD